jgi:DNA topoisomerase-1
MLADVEPQTIVDPKDAARTAGLTYVSTDAPGIRRKRAGKGFTYEAPGGGRADHEARKRAKALVIPPAWRDVWICSDPDGHIQAVGYDEKGRKQYRYHPRFREARDSVKFEHMITFAEALPALRQRVAADMRTHGLRREKVLATVVHLLETTMIRVGNAAYARENKSYGLTTLRSGHVQIEGATLKFHFKGKSGKTWRLGLHDRRVARIVRACQEIPGQHLFQYLDEHGEHQPITSSDINAYLKQASGRDITAKDFRTWAGTVLAATALIQLEAAPSPTWAKRNLTRAITEVAARLGNTPTICRKSYVHPEVMAAYLEGALALEAWDPADDAEALGTELRPEEAAVLAFLRARQGEAAGKVVKGPWPKKTLHILNS